MQLSRYYKQINTDQISPHNGSGLKWAEQARETHLKSTNQSKSISAKVLKVSG